jgi:hypothetical protein
MLRYWKRDAGETKKIWYCHAPFAEDIQTLRLRSGMSIQTLSMVTHVILLRFVVGVVVVDNIPALRRRLLNYVYSGSGYSNDCRSGSAQTLLIHDEGRGEIRSKYEHVVKSMIQKC